MTHLPLMHIELQDMHWIHHPTILGKRVGNDSFGFCLSRKAGMVLRMLNPSFGKVFY